MIANISPARIINSVFAMSLCSTLIAAAPQWAKAEGDTLAKSWCENAASAKPASAQRPHMDVAFCIDTTASMQSEIDMVKTKTKEMVAKLSSGKPAPIIRIGLVAYRDVGDEYVTKVFPFSEDIDKVVKDISNLQAMGGGDGPEAVDQGLHAAIKNLKWDADKHTAKLLFLIGDAGPHGYKNDLDWRADCSGAIKDGIQINTLGCQGLEKYLDSQGTAVFKEIAKLTDGKFESLAYRQEIVDADGKRTTIVHSGGAMYKMRAKPGTEWKGAVARGMLEKVSAPASSGFGMSASSVTAAVAAPMAMRATAGGARGEGISSYNAPSRGDNNLDELMLDAAKDKAQKSLRIGY